MSLPSLVDQILWKTQGGFNIFPWEVNQSFGLESCRSLQQLGSKHPEADLPPHCHTATRSFAVLQVAKPLRLQMMNLLLMNKRLLLICVGKRWGNFLHFKHYGLLQKNVKRPTVLTDSAFHQAKPT